MSKCADPGKSELIEFDSAGRDFVISTSAGEDASLHKSVGGWRLARPGRAQNIKVS